MKNPPQELIREWLIYEPLSGFFRWRKEPLTIGGRLLGFVAGGQDRHGYWRIQIRGFNQIFSHRIAWIYMHGEIPTGLEIDHIDGNPSNNAIANLRLATSSQQKQNRGVQANNRSGLKGAYYHAAHRGKKWRSQIKANGKYIFLGYYDTAQEAHAAYCEVAPRFFGEFARAA